MEPASWRVVCSHVTRSQRPRLGHGSTTHHARLRLAGPHGNRSGWGGAPLWRGTALQPSTPREFLSRGPIYTVNPVEFPKWPKHQKLSFNTVNRDSSLFGRSFMSPNLVRDRPYCVAWSPNQEEHHQPLMLRSWLLQHENARSV